MTTASFLSVASVALFASMPHSAYASRKPLPGLCPEAEKIYGQLDGDQRNWKWIIRFKSSGELIETEPITAFEILCYWSDPSPPKYMDIKNKADDSYNRKARLGSMYDFKSLSDETREYARAEALYEDLDEEQLSLIWTFKLNDGITYSQPISTKQLLFGILCEPAYHRVEIKRSGLPVEIADDDKYKHQLGGVQDYKDLLNERTYSWNSQMGKLLNDRTYLSEDILNLKWKFKRSDGSDSKTVDTRAILQRLRQPVFHPVEIKRHRDSKYNPNERLDCVEDFLTILIGRPGADRASMTRIRKLENE